MHRLFIMIPPIKSYLSLLPGLDWTTLPQVATLDPSGHSLAPPSLSPPPVQNIQPGQVDGSVAIPIISAILITTTLMLVAVYIYRKRR